MNKTLEQRFKELLQIAVNNGFSKHYIIDNLITNSEDYQSQIIGSDLLVIDSSFEMYDISLDSFVLNTGFFECLFRIDSNDSFNYGQLRELNERGLGRYLTKPIFMKAQWSIIENPIDRLEWLLKEFGL